MKSFLIDQSGDFVLENGSFVEVSGDEELAQSVRILLQTANGEWFLDPSIGLNRERIFAKNFNEIQAKDAIIEAISQEHQIVSIENITFTFSKQERLLLVDLTLIKENGETLTLEGVELSA